MNDEENKVIAEEEDVNEDEFVDVASENKLAKIEEEKKNNEAKEASDKEAKAQEDASKSEEEKKNLEALHISPELAGGDVPRLITLNQKGSYDYDDPRLEAVEEARKKWSKDYKIGSFIKVGISMICLAGILLGYILPATLMKDAGQTPLYIALGTAAVSILIMVAVSFLNKKRGQRLIAVYFKEFYDAFDAYAFDGLEIDNVQGDVDQKMSKEEFEGGKAFGEPHSVGSRDSKTFTYKGVDCALADAASQQERNGRGLATTFVGKVLRMRNDFHLSDNGVIIYLKGNDRAIPPVSVLSERPLQESERMAVFGSNKDVQKIPTLILSKLEDIHTDKLLVDATISIQSGRTYIYLGLEDTIMILPNRDPFNPNYLIAFKKILAEFLEVAYLLSGEAKE